MNVTRVLRDLYAQRRWLSGVIGALETASQSPEVRFTAMLAAKLRPGSAPRPLVHLRRQKKAEITRLANLIRRHCGTRSQHAPKLTPGKLSGARVLPFRAERIPK